MPNVVLLFPGQGSQAPGMGKDLAGRFSAAREVFEAADVALGVPLSTLCFEGPADELTLTHNAQPALLTHGAAAWTVVRDIVGAEKMSAIVDWKDRSTCVLFGDGAGAVVLKRSQNGSNRGILSAFLRSDGTLAELLWRPAGGAAVPFSEAVLQDRSSYVKMAGREVFKHAVRQMSEACDRALDGAKLTGNDIDVLIPHQANNRIIEATAKHASIPMEKVYVNVDRFGNTSSASIPIAIDEAIERGRIRPGTTALLCAFGAGFTWGSMVIRF